MVVDRFTGYAQLSRDIYRGQLNILKYKLIVVLCGRSDVLDREVKLERVVQSFVRAVQAINRTATILLSSPLPRADDDERMVRRLHGLGNKIRQQCDSHRVQFTGLASQVSSPRGLQKDMYSAKTLSVQGLRFLKSELEFRTRADCLLEQGGDLTVTVDYS